MRKKFKWSNERKLDFTIFDRKVKRSNQQKCIETSKFTYFSKSLNAQICVLICRKVEIYGILLINIETTNIDKKNLIPRQKKKVIPRSVSWARSRLKTWPNLSYLQCSKSKCNFFLQIHIGDLWTKMVEKNIEFLKYESFWENHKKWNFCPISLPILANHS